MSRSDSVRYGITYAILAQDNDVIPCGNQRYLSWLVRQGGERKSRIKFDRISSWEVETRFEGKSLELDGPHKWWSVRFSGRSQGAAHGPPSSFLAAVDEELAHHPKNLDEATRASGPFLLMDCFSTLKEALEFHALITKRLRAQERGRMPDKAQELLAQLYYWCRKVSSKRKKAP
jgi:hypothetical protein